MFDIKIARTAFTKYVNTFDFENDTIKMKYDHSIRVAENSKQIAVSLGLNDKEIALAELIGLLHDIGRFEQVKIYNSMNDLKTKDHGDWGAAILGVDNFIRCFINTDEYDDLIIKVIKAHNKADIPNEYDYNERLYSKIIRDADKIDILYLGANNGFSIKVSDEALSDSVVESILSETYINKKDVVTELDLVLVHLAFIFDLNFSFSFNVIKENDYISTLIDILNPTSLKAIKVCDKMLEFMNKEFKDKEI